MRTLSLVTTLIFACLQAGVSADELRTFTDCPECPEMIELPLGEFMMGAPDDEFRTVVYFTEQGVQLGTPENPIIPINEGPQNIVVIDIPIAMSRNEVTYDLWMACVKDGGCGGYIPNNTMGPSVSPEELERALTDPRFERTPSQDNIAAIAGTPERLLLTGQYPVTYISALDAQAYTQWLNEKLGTDAYRLPTEAEWEYAARAETTTRFAQGFEPRPEQANISGEATEQDLAENRPDLRTLGFPVPVDELDAANAWGLRHMSGNLFEYTLSCYSGEDSPLPAWRTSSEWLEMSIKTSCDRVVRGGSFTSGMFHARVAYRNRFNETLRSNFMGFRVVREME